MSLQLRGRLGYGVATRRYGLGMQVDDSFDDLADAEEFAAGKLAGAAVICRFSDGRWRPLGSQESAQRIEALRDEAWARAHANTPKAPGWFA